LTISGLPLLRKVSNLRTAELDVSSQESADRAVGQVLSEAGRLDIIIHNHPFRFARPLRQMLELTWLTSVLHLASVEDCHTDLMQIAPSKVCLVLSLSWLFDAPSSPAAALSRRDSESIVVS
jgi:NAD(P)-dependent dehydrogenase (short-subunit alcohol dehydrogenase family)